MHAAALALALVALGTTPSLEDAALWLSRFGIDTDLPRLTVAYSGADVQGSDTTFRLSAADTRTMLATEPTIEWPESAGEKFFLLMLDPDAPKRAKDGSLSGDKGPWLHWMVVNALNSAASGHPMMAYMPPTPPEWSGTHRYIFLLMRQLRPGKLQGFVGGKISDRQQWDAEGFFKANAGALEPIAYNFFYATAERIGGPMDGAAARGDRHIKVGLEPPKEEL